MPKKYVPKLLDFDKLTAAQRRIAIAKDVIAQLNAKRITATTGTYLEPNDVVVSVEDEEKNRPLHECLAQMETCDACAIGSLFIGAVSKFNKVNCGIGDITDDSIQRDILSKYFSQKQLSLMEGFFEVWAHRNDLATIKNMIPYWNKIHKSVNKNAFIIVWEDNVTLYDNGVCFLGGESDEMFGARGDRNSTEPYANARLRWMMKNIIENDGTFKL